MNLSNLTKKPLKNLSKKKVPSSSSNHSFQAAAISADLSPYDLNSLEKREMPLFSSKPWAYLQIRNHILRLWSDNLNNYLTLQEASNEIQEKFKPFVAPIFQFLQRYGFINTGVLTTPNPAPGTENFFLM